VFLDAMGVLILPESTPWRSENRRSTRIATSQGTRP
jgi:hypothetical protein